MSSRFFASDPFHKPHKHEEVLIDFTPMIDCMFLLLMFNMIAYTITGGKDVDVPSARFAKGADAPDAIVVAILEPKEAGGEAPMRLGGAFGEPASLEQIKAAVEDAARAGSKKVVIKAERKVPYRFILDVAQVVGTIEGGTLLMAVQQPN